MTTARYVGEELDLFARAEHWKRYLVAQIDEFVGARVLEVGAGIGGTTRLFCARAHDTWLCLEPDSDQASRASELVEHGELPGFCAVRCGTIADLTPSERFDSILYIDVLEHIEDDASELRAAARHLAKGGHLVVLSPAHPWLYSPFDAAIGHHRRYVKRSLRALGPSDVELIRLRYLDSVGLLASAANRALLRQTMPTLSEVLFWDRVMVRASRAVDPLVGHLVGKSILAVWRNPW